MSNNLELVGQRALVTGGTKGIGKAVVGQLREAGAIVLTTARTSSGDLTNSNLFVAADITTAGGCEAVSASGSRPPRRYRHYGSCRWGIIGARRRICSARR